MKFTMQPLNASALTYAETGDLIARTIAMIGSIPPVMDRGNDSLLSKYLPELTLKHDAYNKALNQHGTDEKTVTVTKGDQVRDVALGNFKKAAKLGRNSDVEAEREASRVICTVLDKYKGIEKLNYGAETENICTLLNDLAAPAMAPHITSLNLQRYIDRLKITNDAFAALHDNRTISANVNAGIQVGRMRRELMLFYKETCLFVQAMANANDGGHYAQVLALINGVRKQYSDLLARRDAKPEAAPSAN